MSGSFGWHSNQKPIQQPTQSYDYDDAKSQYKQKSVKVINPPQSSSNTLAPTLNISKSVSASIVPKQNLKIYNAKHTLKSSAKNVILLA